jgi:hypothetical protein
MGVGWWIAIALGLTVGLLYITKRRGQGSKSEGRTVGAATKGVPLQPGETVLADRLRVGFSPQNRASLSALEARALIGTMNQDGSVRVTALWCWEDLSEKMIRLPLSSRLELTTDDGSDLDRCGVILARNAGILAPIALSWRALPAYGKPTPGQSGERPTRQRRGEYPPPVNRHSRESGNPWGKGGIPEYSAECAAHLDSRFRGNDDASAASPDCPEAHTTSARSQDLRSGIRLPGHQGRSYFPSRDGIGGRVLDGRAPAWWGMDPWLVPSPPRHARLYGRTNPAGDRSLDRRGHGRSDAMAVRPHGTPGGLSFSGRHRHRRRGEDSRPPGGQGGAPGRHSQKGRPKLAIQGMPAPRLRRPLTSRRLPRENTESPCGRQPHRRQDEAIQRDFSLFTRSWGGDCNSDIVTLKSHHPCYAEPGSTQRRRPSQGRGTGSGAGSMASAA